MRKLENAIQGLKANYTDNVEIKSAQLIDHSGTERKKSKVSIIPYTPADIRVIGNDDDLYYAFKYNKEKICELIEQIIEAESPVHINTIGERFRIAYGIGQIGRYIAKEIKDNAAKVVYNSRGKIVQENDISSVNSKFFIKYPFTKTVRTREAYMSVRDFNHIHYYEILNCFL